MTTVIHNAIVSGFCGLLGQRSSDQSIRVCGDLRYETLRLPLLRHKNVLWPAVAHR